MSFLIEKIIIIKKGSNIGEASVYIDNDLGDLLILNKLLIDLTDGSEPIKVPKWEGIPIISGSAYDELKSAILEIFQSIDSNFGIFEVNEDGISKMN